MNKPVKGGLTSILYHDEQKRMEQQRRRETLDRQNSEVMRRTATRHDPIPDMKDAYAKVREMSSEDYPEEYKDYIRRTSGRCV